MSAIYKSDIDDVASHGRRILTIGDVDFSVSQLSLTSDTYSNIIRAYQSLPGFGNAFINFDSYNNSVLQTMVRSSTTDLSLWANSSNKATYTSSVDNFIGTTLAIGALAGTNNEFIGYFSEAIYYSTALDDITREAIEIEQMAYYGM
jgi:hypothetical protein